MIYNAGWDNLISQERKHTPALAASAAKMIEAGESLTATARAHKVSRASLRNWSTSDLTLRKAFEVFEANKQKKEQERERVRRYKIIAEDIMENARNGVADPVAEAIQTPVVQVEPEPEEETPEMRRLKAERAQWRKINREWASDWTPHFEAQQERAEQEAIERQREVQGFWVG